MPSPVKVDIWSDIACPFCYIGKRNFEAGAASSGVPVEIEYHSFELSPDTPDDYSGTHAKKIAEKMRITIDEALAMERRTTEVARGAGIEIDYRKMKPAKTLTAHQLLHYAKREGKQAELKERLMAAYFTEGRHVGHISELAALASEIGLDHDEVVRVLESGEYAAAVAADIQQAQAYGIRGVPFFVIDGKYAVSGAQSTGSFAEVITRASQDKAAAS